MCYSRELPGFVIDGKLGQDGERGLKTGRPDKIIPASVVEDIEAAVYQHLGQLNLAYHSLSHTKDRVMPFAEEYAREIGACESDIQILKIAALYHDYGHAGVRYRQLASGVESPHISNEEYAANAAAEAVKDLLAPDQIEKLRKLILATSFGQNQMEMLPAAHAQLLFRSYQPESNLEKILAFADVSNYRLGRDSYMQDNLDFVSESSAENIPASFEAFVTSCVAFLGYVQKKLDCVKTLFSETFATSLQKQLDVLKADLLNMKTSAVEDYREWSNKFERIREGKRMVSRD